jgi:two-component system, chemotaxis family, sensor kinase CheA
MNDLKDISRIYRQEAEEYLAEIEETVLEIEENHGDQEAVNRLFRAVHTIKGSGAMFGFNEIADFAHHLETALDKVRSGTLAITKELIDLILKSRDHINTMLRWDDTGDRFDDTEGGHIIAALNGLLPEKKDEIQPLNRMDAGYPEDAIETTYRIRFRPDHSLFLNGTDPMLLFEELRAIGECLITPLIRDIPTLDDLNPEHCYLSWDVILTARTSADAIKDVFIFVEGNCELEIDVIDREGDFGENRRLGEILADRKDLPKEEIDKVLNKRKKLGELLVESYLVDKETVVSALTEQKQIKTVRDKRLQETKASSIRVAAEKLDTLVDLVGELVTTQARLSQFSSNQGNQELLSIAEEVERLTSELRDNTMSIRMMPIGITFSNFKRLVRDLSVELGKEIELVTEGAETELDKTVIERLGDPLMHLIRNSIDHGIESPEKRIETQKPRKGTILLKAEHKGAYVVIVIEDDGAGLNVEAIKAKAREKGLISRDAEISDKEAFDLIFAPGFSTAEAVSSVSGRGVGMDVVKKTIDSLRGSIEVNSKRGKGSTIKLKLPLTLAIINGLLVTIGSDCYVIPLAAVEECVELTREIAESSHGANILNLRGEIVPYIRLRDRFGIKDDKPDMEHIVITNVHDRRVGFVVDKVVGGHQTVIKSLGPAFKHMKNLSGATILGDGTVALILDVNTLV